MKKNLFIVGAVVLALGVLGDSPILWLPGLAIVVLAIVYNPVPRQARKWTPGPYEVVLVSMGHSRELTERIIGAALGIGPSHVADLVTSLPTYLKVRVSWEDALWLREVLRNEGADVWVATPDALIDFNPPHRGHVGTTHYLPWPQEDPASPSWAEGSYQVVLTTPGSDPVKTINKVRQLCNCGIKAARDKVMSSPAIIAHAVCKDTAKMIAAELTVVGARTEQLLQLVEDAPDGGPLGAPTPAREGRIRRKKENAP